MIRTLLVTADPDVVDAVLALASDGVHVSQAPALKVWQAAALVIVDDAQARSVIAARLPRRPGVILLGVDLDDASVWERAVHLGAEHVVFLPDASAFLSGRLAAVPASSAA